MISIKLYLIIILVSTLILGSVYLLCCWWEKKLNSNPKENPQDAGINN